jgi:hypothetical protein
MINFLIALAHFSNTGTSRPGSLIFSWRSARLHLKNFSFFCRVGEKMARKPAIIPISATRHILAQPHFPRLREDQSIWTHDVKIPPASAIAVFWHMLSGKGAMASLPERLGLHAGMRVQRPGLF